MTEEKTMATEEKTTTDNVVKKDDNQNPAKKDERRGGGRGRSRGNGRGRKKREPKEFEEAIIQIARVTRVVKGGRRMRFRIAVVIGDKKGRVGFGVGKSGEVLGGIQKAVFAAKKNLINISIDKNTESIPHEIKGKFKASRVLLLPAPKGKGIIAGGAVRKILELAGVKNVLSKMHGSRNALNTTRATLNALQALSREQNPGFREKATEEIKEEKVVKEKKEKVDKKADKKPAKKTTNKK
jgi:small subunit ribosomal protein S5